MGDISGRSMVPNSGIIVIRLEDVQDAFGMYLYLLSPRGNRSLQGLYDESPNLTLNPDILGTLNVPNHLSVSAREDFEKIVQLQHEIDQLNAKIQMILSNLEE